MKKIATCLGTIILVGAAATANAESETFAFSAAELTTMQGIQSTHARIESKAQRFCREMLRGTRSLSGMSSCVRAVTNEIVDNIGDGRLTAYARTGRVDESMLARR